MKKYKIYTTAMTGWIYEISAKNKKEAEDKFYEGEYLKEYEDMDWEGDSGEEVEKIEEMK